MFYEKEDVLEAATAESEAPVMAHADGEDAGETENEEVAEEAEEMEAGEEEGEEAEGEEEA